MGTTVPPIQNCCLCVHYGSQTLKRSCGFRGTTLLPLPYDRQEAQNGGRRTRAKRPDARMFAFIYFSVKLISSDGQTNLYVRISRSECPMPRPHFPTVQSRIKIRGLARRESSLGNRSRAERRLGRAGFNPAKQHRREAPSIALLHPQQVLGFCGDNFLSRPSKCPRGLTGVLHEQPRSVHSEGGIVRRASFKRNTTVCWGSNPTILC